MDIKELKQHFDTATEEVKTLVLRQSEEIKTLGKAREETGEALKGAEKRLDEVATELANGAKRLDELEAAAKRLPMGGDGGEIKLSPGDQFILSEEFKRARSANRQSIDSVVVKSLFAPKTISGMELKEIVGDDPASAGALVQPDRDFEIYRDGARRMNHIRDLMGVRPTASNAVEFIQHNSDFPRAASQNGELAAKKQENITFELKTSPVVTIAHWIPASRQVLDDAPMLRAYIDSELIHGVMLEEDGQILYGDGTAGTLHGIMNTSGVQDVGAMPTGANRIDHLRAAFRDARIEHYMANGVLMHPSDWAEIELLKGSEGQYLWAVVSNIANGAQPVVWRVPVVETTAINEGEFLTGDWERGGFIWDREQANIRVSESHADYFVRNGVAILAEERLALTVNRPKAFVKGQF